MFDLKKMINADTSILFDGSMGALIMGMGYTSNEVYEINVTKPEVITGIHSAYLEAGCDIISTNTFNLSEEITDLLKIPLDELLQAGIACAQKAKANYEGRFIALDIGPCAHFMQSCRKGEEDEVRDYFARRIKQAIGKVDCIAFETFSNSRELSIAVRTARELTDLPIFALMTYTDQLKTWFGEDMKTGIENLVNSPADVIGINCSLAPAEMKAALSEYVPLVDSRKPVCAMANRGYPVNIDSHLVYEMKAEEFAEGVAQIYDTGVNIIGGCCGSDPECMRLVYEKRFRK